MNKRIINSKRPASQGLSAEARVDHYDWIALGEDLDGFGCAILPKLLSLEDATPFRLFIRMRATSEAM